MDKSGITSYHFLVLPDLIGFSNDHDLETVLPLSVKTEQGNGAESKEVINRSSLILKA